MVDPEATIAAEAEQVAVSEEPGGGIKNTVLERIMRLFAPDPRIPANYTGHGIAVWINDKLGAESEEARLGESVNLCLDVLTDGDIGNLPPAVHLGASGFKFWHFKRRTAANRDLPPNPTEVKK